MCHPIHSFHLTQLFEPFARARSITEGSQRVYNRLAFSSIANLCRTYLLCGYEASSLKQRLAHWIDILWEQTD
jgi:hypothetical protein